MSDTYVFNAKTNAVSRYADIAQNQIVQMLGNIFAAGPAVAVMSPTLFADGTIDTGQVDFGSQNLKNVTYVYMGLAIEQPITVDVFADGDTYSYQSVTNSDSILREHRVVFGRGLFARFWAFKVASIGRTILRDFDMLPHIKERRL